MGTALLHLARFTYWFPVWCCLPFVTGSALVLVVFVCVRGVPGSDIIGATPTGVSCPAPAPVTGVLGLDMCFRTGTGTSWFGNDWIEVWMLGSQPRVRWFIRA
eukprot:3816915-Amphidinium_carterae.1